MADYAVIMCVVADQTAALTLAAGAAGPVVATGAIAAGPSSRVITRVVRQAEFIGVFTAALVIARRFDAAYIECPDSDILRDHERFCHADS